jgi:hypothetical protein
MSSPLRRMAFTATTAAALALSVAGTASAAVAPPTAGFSVMKLGGPNIQLNLSISSHPTTVDPSAVDATSAIDWGDGTTTLLTNPFPHYVPHTYTSSGKFTITEVVDDKLGDAPVSYSTTAAVSTTQTAQVQFGGDYASGITSITSPVIDSGSVTIAPTWTVDPASVKQNITLNWGDGQTQKLYQQGVPLTHHYAMATVYPLSIELNDDLGFTNSVTWTRVTYLVNGVAPVVAPVITVTGNQVSVTSQVISMDANPSSVLYCYGFDNDTVSAGPCTSSPLTPAVVTLGPGPHNVEIMVIENFGYNQTLYYNNDFKQVVDFTVG